MRENEGLLVKKPY